MAGKQGRRGWGFIRQLPNKSRRFQASYVGPDLIRHPAPHTFTAKMDAEAWLARERRSIELDEWTPPALRAAERKAGAITLADYAQTWVEQRNVKPRTKILYRALLANQISTTIGRAPMRHLTAEAVRAWYASLGDAHPTRNGHAYGLLRAVCATAVADGLLAANPCTIARTAVPARRQAASLTVAEVAALADTIRPERLKALVLLSAWCGVRWGEVIELRRRDVSADCLTITVARAATHRGGCRIDTPKSGKGRVVVVPPHIRADVQHHLDSYVAKDVDALLFPAAHACHFNDNVFRESFNPALEKIAPGCADPRFAALRRHADGAGRQPARDDGQARAQQRAGIADLSRHRVRPRHRGG